MTSNELEKRLAELEKTVAELKSQSTLSFSLAFLAEQALLWFACLGLLIYFIPPMEKLFKDYNMVLPDSTIRAIKIAHWFQSYWYLLLPGLALVFGLGGSLLAFISARRPSLGRTLRLLNLFPLLFIAFVVWVIALPLVKLLNGLTQ